MPRTEYSPTVVVSVQSLTKTVAGKTAARHRVEPTGKAPSTQEPVYATLR